MAFNCREENNDFAIHSEPFFIHKNIEVLKVQEEIETICDVLYNLD